MELTRRHILAGSAGLAAAPLLPAITANAAAPMADKQAPSFYRYKVGDVQVTVISDGVNTFPLGDSFVLNAKKDEVAAALEKGLHAEGQGQHPVRTAGDQFRRQADRPRHRQRSGRLCIEQGRRRPIRHQHGRGRLRSEERRHGGDLAFPWRPHQRPAQRRRNARVRQRRSAGAVRRVEILHGRWRNGQADRRAHAGRVQERPPRVRGRAQEEGDAL